MPPPHPSSSSSSSSSSLFNPYSANLKRRRKSNFILSIGAITIIIIYFIFNTTGHYQLQQILHQQQKQEKEQQQQYHDVIINNRHEPKSSTSGINIFGMNHHEHKNTMYNDYHQSTFIPTLRNKKIFFEVVTVGLKQFSYLEDIIDAVRDMCEAGAHVSFHITSSNCNPKGGKEGDEDECPIRNQSSEETKEDNFNVETISHLNERVRCRNPEGKLDMSIHLVSPDWG